MSAYERMVMDLFPLDEGRVDGVDDGAVYANAYDDADPGVSNVIHPDWMEPLLSLTKSSSRSLVRQLSTRAFCPMGYDPHANPMSRRRPDASAAAVPAAPAAPTPLLSYVRTQKSAHFPDAVVLTRVGDFYETYGVDAIMLVEHCGLNPMAGKARAGCPWRNVQDTLDKLTSAGYRVAVYEENERDRRDGNGWRNDEGVDADANGGAGGVRGGKLKTRYLAQVALPSNPTYMHGLVLNDDCGVASADDDASSPPCGDSSSPVRRDHVGVIETNVGYTLVEICGGERTVIISERLTSEAVCCRLAAFPPADPIFYVPPPTMTLDPQRRSDPLPFLPWARRQQASQRFSRGGGLGAMAGRVRVKTLPPSLAVGPRPGLSDVDRAKQTIVSAFLRLEEYDHRNPVDSTEPASSPPMRKRGMKASAVTHDDFTVVVTPTSSRKATITSPLHLETATQLGLMSDPAIPSLISSLLPVSAPSSTRRYLRQQ
jgi:hypothetical protein